ncbi:MAG: prepilin-type N-terminal cleavage/methylation domain-containing protein [Coriobacteriia bacterium]|nr:prepilin-type N-terminal cleavage/methylation domain-containing protein [Coriobacteriia bacterium]
MGTESKECRAVNTDGVMITSTRDRKAPATDAGFTFVEILVALAILSIAITGLIGLIEVNTMTSVRAQELSRVTDSMADLADMLRNPAITSYESAGVTHTKYISIVSTDIPHNVSVEPCDGPVPSNASVVMSVEATTIPVSGTSIKTITIGGYSTRFPPPDPTSNPTSGPQIHTIQVVLPKP